MSFQSSGNAAAIDIRLEPFPQIVTRVCICE